MLGNKLQEFPCKKPTKGTLLDKLSFGFLREDTGVDLYENGIVVTFNEKPTELTWDQIEELKVFEWYDHRFAPQQFNVAIILPDKKQFRFMGKNVVNGDVLIEALKAKISNYTYVPFSA